MQDTYIEIMLQSLRRKLDVLDEIMKQDELQREQLERADGSVEDFDRTVQEKAELLERLEQLDNGFEELYAHVQEELKVNGERYADQIRLLQEYIRHITERSMQIQAQEARNKSLLTRKFTRVRQQGKAVRVNARATAQYYQNMTRTNFIAPQFMDDKK